MKRVYDDQGDFIEPRLPGKGRMSGFARNGSSSPRYVCHNCLKE